MEPRLTEIPEKEALLYLGYKGGGLPPELLETLTRCRETILKTARPRAAYRVFPWDPEGPLPGTALTLQGRDIRTLLQDCRRVILFGVTLGMEVEQLLRRAQVRDMAEAVMLDSCASAAVENVCENLAADLAGELGGHPTDRFSPGYGDLPFSQQPALCRVLELDKRIGVTLTPGGLMVPQKSVTALMGLSDRPQPKRNRGCAVCPRFRTCTIRKEGHTCGQSS